MLPPVTPVKVEASHHKCTTMQSSGPGSGFSLEKDMRKLETRESGTIVGARHAARA